MDNFSNGKFQVIDADAHVIETEASWEYLDAPERKYRPRLYSANDDADTQYWVLEDKILGFRFQTLSEKKLKELTQRSGRNSITPKSARELEDVELRLDHMDELGIDVQVLHNTLWVVPVSDRPEIEAALCRSWNRWLADIWKRGKGRLRWSCVVPTEIMGEAIAQMRFARENGAVAVAIRPVEGNRSLTDPYFYPIYQEAAQLNLAIAVHIANGNPASHELFRSFPGGLPVTGLGMFRAPAVVACHMLILSDIPELFPGLRWGFIETSAQWVPWISREVARRFQRRGGDGEVEGIFRRCNIFVTCESDDDLPWILKYAGEETLLIGTDYGHNDASSDTNAIRILKQRSDVSDRVKWRILSENPKALYGLTGQS